MPRYRDGFPHPRKEYHHGTWRIAWRWDDKKYSVSTAIADKANVREIEILLRDLAHQLASNDRPVLSDLWISSPGVMRYVDDRFGEEGALGNTSDPRGWVEEYAPEIAAECSSSWAKESIVRLHKLSVATDGFANITPESASKYLAGIAAKRSAATRNRALITFTRFFKWAIRTGRTATSPFAGIRQLPEPRRADIVHCTPEERDEIIALARETGWPDWLAVPVAFYAGMRREEVANLRWSDVRFDEGLIVVNKAKTRKSRVFPLSAKLEALLAAIPATERRGYVVKIPDGFNRVLRLENLVRRIEKDKRNALLAEWSLEKPPPSRSKEYPAALKRWKAAMAERAQDMDAALERIGWNSFRHTFGSLLAQAGVSIDKISAWMGNTPEVCRRHYAQFIPRDRRDSEIDKM